MVPLFVDVAFLKVNPTFLNSQLRGQKNMCQIDCQNHCQMLKAAETQRNHSKKVSQRALKI